MPRQPRQLSDSGIYHVMLRGVNRDAIFLEEDDYERFLRTLALVKAASGCKVLAYCLMTNHAHLVLMTTDEPIGAVMKRLGVRYVHWFNRKYGRVGHLFQSRFRSIPVENDSYLATLIGYVWNNPVVAGTVTHAEQYDWSSRRHLGHDSILVDHKDLRELLPEGGLAELATCVPPDRDETLDVLGMEPYPTDLEISELLRQACGASSPSEFCELDKAVQKRAIAELRARSASYARIAKATGMSVSAVRRMHVAALGR